MSRLFPFARAGFAVAAALAFGSMAAAQQLPYYKPVEPSTLFNFYRGAPVVTLTAQTKWAQYGGTELSPKPYACNECVPQSGECCKPRCTTAPACCPPARPWRLQDCIGPGIKFGGWAQAGYTSDSTGMFNNIPDRVNLHQGWFYVEKVADGRCGSDWGFRADLVYGTDAGDTQAFGGTPGRWDFQNGWDYGGGYGWALPQLYAEYANQDVSVKLGHFFTLLGYETVTAPDNFFFSHAMTMFNSEAFTHTGALATIYLNDRLTTYMGWTLGWDTGFDHFRGGSNFLGGFKLKLSRNATYSYITTVGDMGLRGKGYTHSTVLDVALTCKLNYVLQSDMVTLELNGGRNNESGINQYLLYTINDKWRVGTRMEWWKSDAGFNHGGNSTPKGGSQSYYAATIGANYRPNENVVIRPEYRHDWFPGSVGGGYDQGIFACDVIFTY